MSEQGYKPPAEEDNDEKDTKVAKRSGKAQRRITSDRSDDEDGMLTPKAEPERDAGDDGFSPSREADDKAEQSKGSQDQGLAPTDWYRSEHHSSHKRQRSLDDPPDHPMKAESLPLLMERQTLATSQDRRPHKRVTFSSKVFTQVPKDSERADSDGESLYTLPSRSSGPGQRESSATRPTRTSVHSTSTLGLSLSELQPSFLNDVPGDTDHGNIDGNVDREPSDGSRK